MPRKRKETFVTSFMQPLIELRNKGRLPPRRKFVAVNMERLQVMEQLVKKGKRVVLVVRKDASPGERKFVERAKKVTGPGRLKVIHVDSTSSYSGSWQRDNFTKLNVRYLNKMHAEDRRKELNPRHRHFGEGGRVIKAGKIKGKEVLLVSDSILGLKGRHDPKIDKLLKGEADMLRRQGFEVFELPGYWFRAEGIRKGENAEREFFEHLDVFINTIPEKKVLLVDPEYMETNSNKIRQLNKFLKYKIIEVPKEERFHYPSNILKLGNGEVIVNSAAKKTIALLKKADVKVFATPKEIKYNLEFRGGVGCFVNID